MNVLFELVIPVAASVLAVAGLTYLHRYQSRQRRGSASKASTDPYGKELAMSVADRMQRGDTLSYGHRDYCGTGLRFVDGNFIYGEVVDGDLPSEAEQLARTTRPSNTERLVFSSRSSFVEWLAAQSDATLVGTGLQPAWLVGNQRITGRRLRSFASGKPVPSVE
jgi:hypothetical protein